MKHEISPERLTAYVLGELDSKERTRIQAALSADPELRRLTEELEQSASQAFEAFQQTASPAGLTEAQRQAVRNSAQQSSGHPAENETIKIKCHACSAQYGIGRDKVEGKTIRFTCKRCQASITVDGRAVDQLSDAPPSIEPREDLFAQAPGEALFGGSTNDDAKENLFTSSGMTGGLFEQSLGVPTQPTSTQPKPAASTGQRGEDSVLFSLNRLQTLSTDAQQDEALAASKSEQVGSGLIDIRALAGSIADPQDAPGEDLLPFDASPAFQSPLGTPGLIVPDDRSSRRDRKWVVIVAAVVVVAVAAVVTGILIRTDQQPNELGDRLAALESKLAELNQTPERDQRTPHPKAQQADLAKSPVHESETRAPTSGTAGNTNNKRTRIAGATPRSSRKGKSRRQPVKSTPNREQSDRAKSSSNSAVNSKPTPAAAPKEKATRSPKKSTAALDDLLGKSTIHRQRSKKAAGSSQSSDDRIPKKLSRSDVQAGMRTAASGVKRCGQGQGGTITMAVTIAGTGRVTSAAALGPNAGTPVGLCAARAVRKARFPKFDGPKINVKYPFKL